MSISAFSFYYIPCTTFYLLSRFFEMDLFEYILEIRNYLEGKLARLHGSS